MITKEMILSGISAGVVELIREYRDGLVLYLNSILRDIGTAEEICEDTFVKLVTKRPRFSGRSSFRTWLYAIGRNLALDHLRRNAKLTALPEAESLADMESLEQGYIREERRIVVHRAMGKLNPEYRQVLWLSYFEEFTNAETAKLMKKSKRQVENLLYRAKQSLRTELEKEGITHEDL